ncbi:MAG: hypothetical protein M0P32_04975, partial [Bacteroidales bacterium]|nr:hypothetical protein [Bacteroidales bacterium]
METVIYKSKLPDFQKSQALFSDFFIRQLGKNQFLCKPFMSYRAVCKKTDNCVTLILKTVIYKSKLPDFQKSQALFSDFFIRQLGKNQFLC